MKGGSFQVRLRFRTMEERLMRVVDGGGGGGGGIVGIGAVEGGIRGVGL